MRLKATTAAITLSLASATAVGIGVTTATPAFAATCPDNGWSILDGSIGQFFNGNGINIRTGPSTACTSLGQGQASHSVRLDCFKSGQAGGGVSTWTHVRDRTTGVQGWVRDDLLVGFGSFVHC